MGSQVGLGKTLPRRKLARLCIERCAALTLPGSRSGEAGECEHERTYSQAQTLKATAAVKG